MSPDVTSSYREGILIKNCIILNDPKSYGIELGDSNEVVIEGCVVYPQLTLWEHLRLRLGFTVRGLHRG